jgi:hypothetical protein
MAVRERMIFMSQIVNCRLDVNRISLMAGEKGGVLVTGPSLPSITAPSIV